MTVGGRARGLLLLEATDSSVVLLRANWKHQAFRVACSEQMHRANAFRMGSINASFITKSCACASVAFLAGIISLSVDYNDRFGDT